MGPITLSPEVEASFAEYMRRDLWPDITA